MSWRTSEGMSNIETDVLALVCHLFPLTGSLVAIIETVFQLSSLVRSIERLEG